MNSRLLISFVLFLSLSLTMAGCKESAQSAEADQKNPSVEAGNRAETEAPAASGDDMESALQEVARGADKMAESGMGMVKEDIPGMDFAFTLDDQNGNSINLADYAGKIIVLEWINPDCPFVQRHYEAKTMINLARQYQDKGVVWLAVNSTNHWNQQKNHDFHQTQKLPYPVLDDHSGVVGKLFKAKTTPHMYIIDTKGKIAYQGAIDDDPHGNKGSGATNYVKQALDELLAGKSVSVAETKPYGCSVKYAP